MNQSDQEWLKNRVAAAVDDDYYLDRDEERRIKEEGAARGILTKEIEIIVREQLEVHSAVSERLLIDELDRLLHQFTDNDRKLDQKEERLALDKVIRAAPGKNVVWMPVLLNNTSPVFARRMVLRAQRIQRSGLGLRWA